MPFCPFWHVFGSFEKKPVIIPPPQIKSNSTVPKPVSPIYIPFELLKWWLILFLQWTLILLFSPPLFPKMNSVYLSWKKNQEPNNLINQKDKYIVPSTDIQKMDEIHSREKFKDFLDYRNLLILGRCKSYSSHLYFVELIF